MSLQALTLSVLSDWLTTLSLIFGGCCSNAISLEQLTSEYPRAGSLITLFQFLFISLHGLWTHLTWTPSGPRFRQRKIPLAPYLVQVTLFYLVSLLNNAAFAYQIPMGVHIIFRSGGLVVSMLLGWLIAGKRYSPVQIISVLLVTVGIALTTLSASQSSSDPSTSQATFDLHTYARGIAMLTLALVFSGFLGLVQDWTYSRYGRPSPSKSTSPNGGAKGEGDSTPTWQESMFYLHFLALPMFFFLRDDLMTQLSIVNSSPSVVVLLPSLPTINLRSATNKPPALDWINHFHRTSIPRAYIPLLMNTLTQLLCVAGVHQLTTRVSALTVTLVLVVRKAVSLIISVVGSQFIHFGSGRGSERVDAGMMWSGAALVFIGTVGYSIGTSSKRKGKDKKE